MSSNRPETSLPPPTSEAPDLSAADGPPSEPIILDKPYTPKVIDLIPPTQRARVGKVYIPPIFLRTEAVDSSLPLGYGASFAVTRQALPPGPEHNRVRSIGFAHIETVTKAPPRPKHVVYKTARVSFEPNGDPSTPRDRRALQSVLTEFHVLLHRPLLDHENIINFLGLAWGSHHVDPLHRLPVLVVEYGDRGTLADVQLRGSALSNALKLDIARGIGRGLEALHRHGIIHGDLKPDNIIMCSHAEKQLVPKLADFGFAIVESAESSHVTIGGTRIWRAPESYSSIPISQLTLTDVYSFGLVAWSIAIDGKDPFSLFLSNQLGGEPRFVEIDRLKDEDEVLNMSKFDRWVLSWTLLGQLKTAQPKVLSNGKVAASLLSDPSMMQSMLSLMMAKKTSFQVDPQVQAFASDMPAQMRRRVYFKVLESLLACTLRANPKDRNFTAAMRLLESGDDQGITSSMSNLSVHETAQTKVDGVPGPDTVAGADASSSQGAESGILNASNKDAHSEETVTSVAASLASPIAKDLGIQSSGEIDWSALGYKSHQYSWQLVRDLDPAVQAFVVSTMLQAGDRAIHFTQSAFYSNGYGVASDPVKALEAMDRAASEGHSVAQAYLYRFYKAYSKSIPPESPILQYLRQQASNGSRMALADLRELDPQQAKHTRERLKYGFGGVGALWFLEDNWLHGLSQPKLASKDFSLESLGARSDLPDVIVNIRGDRIIHAAAASGQYTLVKELLTDIGIDVNQRNAMGETALLCACRSGHANTVQLLLDSGADASIQALNGESPLHWLIAFDDNINPAAVGNDLIQRGKATVDAFTTERIRHSAFPGTIDVDFQVQGTPLMWAVHHNKPRIVSFLLSKGANAQKQYDKGVLSGGEDDWGSGIPPLQWAAYYHHTECLKLMIDHLENSADVPMTTEGKRDLRFAVLYRPLAQAAIHASDPFSMIIRNGADYLTQLEATLSLLQERTKFIYFHVGDRAETLLKYAAREAHDEACEALLKLGWRINEINHASGPEGMTPIHESIRWNRPKLFHLFQKYGADPCAKCTNPFTGQVDVWSALHIFADQAHNDDLSLIEDILKAGVPVDGGAEQNSIETPFQLAVRRNAFRLADLFLEHGASLNATSTHSSIIISKRRLTALGHAIALNARHSLTSIRYLLGNGTDFIVEPEHNFSALHLCAIVPSGLSYAGGGLPVEWKDYDSETSNEIVRELFEWFGEPEQLDMRCGLEDKTALHLAVEFAKVDLVRELIRAGADRCLKCKGGETPEDVARRVWSANGQMMAKLLTGLGQ